MNGWLAGLAGGLEGFANAGQAQLDKLWEERKMKLIEEQQMRLQDRQNERSDFEYARGRKDKISDMQSDRDFQKEMYDVKKQDQYDLADYKNNLSINNPSNVASARKTNADADLAELKVECLKNPNAPGCGLLESITGKSKTKPSYFDAADGTRMQTDGSGMAKPVYQPMSDAMVKQMLQDGVDTKAKGIVLQDGKYYMPVKSKQPTMPISAKDTLASIDKEITAIESGVGMGEKESKLKELRAKKQALLSKYGIPINDPLGFKQNQPLHNTRQARVFLCL